MTALEFMGWELVENMEDATSYFEREDGSTGFIKAIPQKTWKSGQWIEENEVEREHRFYMEEVMSRCPLSWREIQDFSRIQVLCRRDMHYNSFDKYPCYRVIEKAAPQEEIAKMSDRSSQVCTFLEDGWEPETDYSWRNCIIDGYFGGVVDEGGRVDSWWHGTDGAVDHEGNVAYKRLDLRFLLLHWCHLLAVCPGIDLLMGVADYYNFMRANEENEAELERRFLEQTEVGVKAGQGKVELIEPGEFRKLCKEYKKACGR